MNDTWIEFMDKRPDQEKNVLVYRQSTGKYFVAFYINTEKSNGKYRCYWVTQQNKGLMVRDTDYWSEFISVYG